MHFPLCIYLLGRRNLNTNLFKAHLYKAPCGNSRIVYLNGVSQPGIRSHTQARQSEMRGVSKCAVSHLIDCTLCLPSTRFVSASQDIVKIASPFFFVFFFLLFCNSPGNGSHESGKELGDDGLSAFCRPSCQELL